jgi:hypothetical protein
MMANQSSARKQQVEGIVFVWKPRSAIFEDLSSAMKFRPEMKSRHEMNPDPK